VVPKVLHEAFLWDFQCTFFKIKTLNKIKKTFKNVKNVAKIKKNVKDVFFISILISTSYTTNALL